MADETIHPLGKMSIEDIRALIAADESRTLELNKSTGELKDGMHAGGVLKKYHRINAR